MKSLKDTDKRWPKPKANPKLFKPMQSLNAILALSSKCGEWPYSFGSQNSRAGFIYIETNRRLIIGKCFSRIQTCPPLFISITK